MAGEGSEHCGTSGTHEDKPKKTREARKTVRFMNSDNGNKCGNLTMEQMQKNPVAMMQSLVPQLPGLDRDTLYVISGPFPNYDPAHGHSQLLMATPISPGVTVVAVPTGPPLQLCPGPVNHTISHNMPAHTCNNTGPQKQRRDLKPPQPMSSPHPPHMLHWDTHHPVGQTIPLRQPNPPVYYNVPSHTSSGLQSPASQTSCMSDGSSMSDSSSNSMYESGGPFQFQVHPEQQSFNQQVPVHCQQGGGGHGQGCQQICLSQC